MLRKIAVVPVILLACTFNVCYAANSSALYGKAWVLQQLQKKDIDLTKYSGEKPNIKFEGKLRYNAFAGCNRISGNFIVTEPNVLKFDPNAAMTKMFCGAPTNIEDQFVTMLDLVHSWEIKDKELRLYDASNNKVAVFKQ